MSDVESASLLRQQQQQRPGGAANNPYQPPPSGTLPPNHIFYKLQRTAIMGAALWGLHEFSLYHTVLRSPDVSHAWFKLGLASSVAILIIKSYVELYEGRTKKKKVEYANFKQTTHLMIFLILMASLSFHVALWPHYGGFKTMLIMFMFGYGVLLQFALLVPTWVQNLVSAALMTFFIQQYV